MLIQGDRVILKKTSEEDLENLMSLWNNGYIIKWVGFPNGLDYNINELIASILLSSQRTNGS